PRRDQCYCALVYVSAFSDGRSVFRIGVRLANELVSFELVAESKWSECDRRVDSAPLPVIPRHLRGGVVVHAPGRRRRSYQELLCSQSGSSGFPAGTGADCEDGSDAAQVLNATTAKEFS